MRQTSLGNIQKNAKFGLSPITLQSQELEASEIIARQDRIPIWALSYLFIGILGMGYVFIFYDIFNINVSFIQTALTLGWARSPTSPAITSLEGPAVLLNLVGYVIGALVLSPLSDRYGRREMLMFTLLVTGVGSLLNAFVSTYLWFVAARTITGIGVGADLALVNTYISEVAPTNGRAKYTALLFVLAGIGTVSAVWLGLFLTTPSTPFPYGLPIAIGGSGFMATNGWRVMYAVGGVLAFLGVLLRVSLPESTRWLITKKRLNEAAMIVSQMEERAMKRVKQLPPIPAVIHASQKVKSAPYSEILKNPTYRNRMILLFFVWFFGYMTIYIISAAMSPLLVALGFPFPENGIIVSFGVFGFVVAGLIVVFFGDKMERNFWAPVGAVITLTGAISIGYGVDNITLATVGALLIFVGIDIWVPITYAWSAESFPTRARATGFALADGVGHVGGGVGLIAVAAIISSLLPILGTIGIFLVIALFQVISTALAQLGAKTANRRFDEVSP